MSIHLIIKNDNHTNPENRDTQVAGDTIYFVVGKI